MVRRNKCGNRKVVTADGEKYDSIKERDRHCELLLMQRAGKITDIKRQIKFLLIPSIREDGKVIERECSYIADFVYTDMATGKMVVEDVKGYRNTSSAVYALFVIKRKLMLYQYGIRVREV